MLLLGAQKTLSGSGNECILHALKVDLYSSTVIELDVILIHCVLKSLVLTALCSDVFPRPQLMC